MATTIILDSNEFFFEMVDEAFQERNLDTYPHVKTYVVDVLKHYLVTENLYDEEDSSGKKTRKTLAELLLTAANSHSRQKIEQLKKLGDSSLYISGFFPDSFQRKIIDVDYYVDMGGVAYGALAQSSSDEMKAKMYGDFASNFPTFVDVLAFISQESSIQTNGDLLKLYDRYIATGSRLAEERLVEKGLINADLPKVKTHKM